MPAIWHYIPKGRMERLKDRCWVDDSRKLCLWGWVLIHLPLFCPPAHRGTRAGWAGPAATTGLQGGASHQCHVHRELKGEPPVPGRGTQTSYHTGVSKRRMGQEKGIKPQSWLPTETSWGERERLLSQCQPCFVTASSCQKDSEHHPIVVWAQDTTDKEEEALQAERLEPDGSASVTAALHENSLDVYWEIMRTLFNFLRKREKTEIKQNIKPPCPTSPTFV